LIYFSYLYITIIFELLVFYSLFVNVCIIYFSVRQKQTLRQSKNKLKNKKLGLVSLFDIKKKNFSENKKIFLISSF